MASSFLLKRLAIPLTFLAVALLLVGAGTSGYWQNLTLGLGTTVLGTLFTVFYVETMQHQHNQRQEAQRWQTIDQRMDNALAQMAYQIVMDFSDTIKADERYRALRPDFTSDYARLGKQLLRYCSWVIEPAWQDIEAHSADAPTDEDLKRYLDERQKESDRILDTYGPRLDPERFDKLLWVSEIADYLRNRSISDPRPLLLASLILLPDARQRSSSKGTQPAGSRLLQTLSGGRFGRHTADDRPRGDVELDDPAFLPPPLPPDLIEILERAHIDPDAGAMDIEMELTQRIIEQTVSSGLEQIKWVDEMLRGESEDVQPVPAEDPNTADLERVLTHLQQLSERGDHVNA